MNGDGSYWTRRFKVFVSQGYHAAAMDDIAERAGVSKPVPLPAFPRQARAPNLALLDESVGTLLETVGDALRSNPDPKQRVAATLRRVLRVRGRQGPGLPAGIRGPT